MTTTISMLKTFCFVLHIWIYIVSAHYFHTATELVMNAQSVPKTITVTLPKWWVIILLVMESKNAFSNDWRVVSFFRDFRHDNRVQASLSNVRPNGFLIPVERDINSIPINQTSILGSMFALSSKRKSDQELYSECFLLHRWGFVYIKRPVVWIGIEFVSYIRLYFVCKTVIICIILLKAYGIMFHSIAVNTFFRFKHRWADVFY